MSQGSDPGMRVAICAGCSRVRCCWMPAGTRRWQCIECNRAVPGVIVQEESSPRPLPAADATLPQDQVDTLRRVMGDVLPRLLRRRDRHRASVRS